MLANHQVTKPNTNYVIANYLRISKEDNMRDESNSITNQRNLIKNFISCDNKLKWSKVIDYVDDGASGSNTDRKAYQRLMRDVKNGAINCIIVKDLSRIGRNLIDVDDLLMNYLVDSKTRFIAINNNYDSFLHPLSTLELALINLSNQHYNKDLAMKSITSKQYKMRKGEYLSCFALYGYKKSEIEKNKLEIDIESAEYVRLIFSLAIAGHTVTEIAKIINAQDIPTPGSYKKQQGVKCMWATIDENYSFWDSTLVRRILIDERYAGKGISNRFKVKIPGKNGVIQRPKDEWIVVPNAHEAIISDRDFQKAQLCLKRSRRNDVPVDHIFYKKIKCPICGRTMKRISRYSPHFKCITKKYTDYYDCTEFSVSQENIEEAVIQSVKAYATALIEREELKLSAINQVKQSKIEIEYKIKMEQKAIQLLENSITKAFTSFISGKISQENFQHKKEVINNTIAQKQSELQELNESLQIITIEKTVINETLAELKIFQEIEKLDRDTVDLLIDKIFVHSEQQIEIVWVDEY